MTGGPGGGKTAALEVAKREFCRHVVVMPEAASMVYKGGFIRKNTPLAIKAVQRAIYHVQNELHQLVQAEQSFALGLCDRGTLDGLAYWSDTEQSFYEELRTTREKELQKYAVVIHLRTPPSEYGYNQDNPIRTESVEEALDIDQKIERAWRDHPKRTFVES